MTSYRHVRDRRPDRAGDVGGAYGVNPLERMASVLDEFEAMKRRVLATFQDMAAWDGTAQTTGYTHIFGPGRITEDWPTPRGSRPA